MKVTGIKAVKIPKSSPLRRIKNFYSSGLLRLKTLVKDVFEKRESKYIIFDGKKMKERDLPNYVTGPSDLKGVTWGTIKYFPEDVEKMKCMNVDERIRYKQKLIKENKYIETECF